MKSVSDNLYTITKKLSHGLDDNCVQFGMIKQQFK